MSADGIILFAHGSRDELWHRPIQAVAQRVRTLAPQSLVLCAYLEISTPTLSQACQNMVNEGVGRISVVPLFLGVGKHAREDLPQLLSDIQAQHPQLDLTCQRPVGENQAVIELLAQLALGRPMPY